MDSGFVCLLAGTWHQGILAAPDCSALQPLSVQMRSLEVTWHYTPRIAGFFWTIGPSRGPSETNFVPDLAAEFVA